MDDHQSLDRDSAPAIGAARDTDGTVVPLNVGSRELLQALLDDNLVDYCKLRDCVENSRTKMLDAIEELNTEIHNFTAHFVMLRAVEQARMEIASLLPVADAAKSRPDTLNSMAEVQRIRSEELKDLRTYSNTEHLPDTIQAVCDDIKKTALDCVQAAVDCSEETVQHDELQARQAEDAYLQLVIESVTRNAETGEALLKRGFDAKMFAKARDDLFAPVTSHEARKVGVRWIKDIAAELRGPVDQPPQASPEVSSSIDETVFERRRFRGAGRAQRGRGRTQGGRGAAGR